MLLQDIISRVRVAVGDLYANQFTESTILSWINDGIRECAQENMLLQKTAASTLVAGTVAYTLPTDILKLYALRIDGAKVDIITLQEYEKQNYDPSETGLPVLAYVWAGKYNVWPSPDRDYSVSVDYLYTPVDLVEPDDLGNPPPIPSTYHSRLVDYCIAQAALQDDNKELYALKMEEFSTGIMKLSDQTQQEEDLYPSTSVSARDLGDGAYDWIEW